MKLLLTDHIVVAIHVATFNLHPFKVSPVDSWPIDYTPPHPSTGAHLDHISDQYKGLILFQQDT